MKKILYSLCFVSVLMAQAPPSRTELELKKHIEELFEFSKKANDPKEKHVARAKMEGAMEWERVARDCLGSTHWKKYGGGYFQKLLREVIINSAYSRMDSFWKETTYHVEKVEVKGKTGYVASRFIVNQEPFVLEYYLNKQGNKWLIYDIGYEGLRYGANINEQIDAFLKEKSFSNLLEKLRKRRDELKAELNRPK